MKTKQAESREIAASCIIPILNNNVTNGIKRSRQWKMRAVVASSRSWMTIRTAAPRRRKNRTPNLMRLICFVKLLYLCSYVATGHFIRARGGSPWLGDRRQLHDDDHDDARSDNRTRFISSAVCSAVTYSSKVPRGDIAVHLTEAISIGLCGAHL